jgi:hypothetical protein
MSTPSPAEPTEPEHRKNPWNDPIAFLPNWKILWPDDQSHPAQVAIRTYSLSLLFSLGPALLPVALDFITHSPSLKTRSSQLLRRELGFTGFPFAITLAVGGGVAFKHLWEAVDVHHIYMQDDREVLAVPSGSTPRRRAVFSLATHVFSLTPNSTPSQRTFLSNVLSSAIALFLLQRIQQSKSGSHRPSPTFELTLLFAFRAADAVMQHFLSVEAARRARPDFSTTHSHELTGPPARLQLAAAAGDRKAKEWHRRTAAWLDTILFWASSARYVTRGMLYVIKFILVDQDHVVFLLQAAQVHNNEVDEIYV